MRSGVARSTRCSVTVLVDMIDSLHGWAVRNASRGLPRTGLRLHGPGGERIARPTNDQSPCGLRPATPVSPDWPGGGRAGGGPGLLALGLLRAAGGRTPRAGRGREAAGSL